MAAHGPERRRSGGRQAAAFIVAHAVAVAAGSVALAATALAAVLLERAGLVDAGAGDADVSPLLALGGALFVAFWGMVGGAVFALPASLAGWPLARWAVRRGVGGARLVLLGGAAGLGVGLPVLVTILSLGDARFLADPVAGVLDAVPAFGPAAAAAGAGFAWIVGRLTR